MVQDFLCYRIYQKILEYNKDIITNNNKVKCEQTVNKQ